MLPFCCHRGLQNGKKPLFTGFFTGVKLFPLNCAGGLGGEVVKDAVDVLDFARDAFGDVLQQCEGDFFYGSGHRIYRVDCAKNDGICERALAILHTDRFEIGYGGEVLPNLTL